MSEAQTATPQFDPSKVSVESMFTEVLQQKLQSGLIEQAIEKQMDNLIGGLIGELFNSWGDIGKALKEQLAQAMCPAVDELKDFPRYNQYVASVIKTRVQQFRDEKLTEVINAELDKVLQELPAEIDFSKLIEEVVENCSEALKDDGLCGTEISLHIEDDSLFTHLYFDVEPDKEKYECKYQLDLHSGQVYGLRIDGMKNDALILGSKYGFERMLLNLYALKGKVCMDKGTHVEDYELYAAGADDF